MILLTSSALSESLCGKHQREHSNTNIGVDMALYGRQRSAMSISAFLEILFSEWSMLKMIWPFFVPNIVLAVFNQDVRERHTHLVDMPMYDFIPNIPYKSGKLQYNLQPPKRGDKSAAQVNS